MIYEALFGAASVFMADTGRYIECYLPVSMNMAAGTYALKVNRYSDSPGISDSRSIDINVNDAGFAVENISFSSKKKKTIADPKNKIERAMLNQAFSTVSPVVLFRDRFDRPAQGRNTGVFGSTRKTGGKVLWQHRGLDFAAPRGTPVKAPARGKVILTRDDFILHGKTVVVDHGLGVMSVYIHLDSIQCKKNSMLERGDPIGKMGSTGLTTASNLHWGVYVLSIPVNPEKWLKDE
jgi:murein DD-endopeptidase MepM/ murein hydrolase activator NlpD